MESCKITPSSNAHITHSKASKFHEEGIQAHIFIEKPADPGYEQVGPNSVHLTTAPKGQTFKLFKNVKEEEKLIFGLSVYLELLAFFETEWLSFKADMEKKFQVIKRKKTTVECHPDIHFFLNGTATCERWFGDICMHFKKSSTDLTAGNLYLREAGSKFILINPDVMHELSKSRLALVDVLFNAGYNENVVMVDIQS